MVSLSNLCIMLHSNAVGVISGKNKIHHTIEYVRHNTISYTLNEIIFAIKSDFETEKLFESKNTKEEENKIASPIRQALISQLEELVNHAQARALNDLEKGVLSPEEYNTNIPFHVWMHRLQGVVQVILNTPEYSDDTRAKIIDIMHKLQEIKCL